MAVANPCVSKEWEEWKREMVENRRRRWGENYWTNVAVDGNEKDDWEEEEAEDTVSEEEAVEETGEEDEEEKGRRTREAEELVEDEENELWRGHKKQNEEEGGEAIEADERVDVERDKEEDEVDAQEEMMLVQVDKWQEEKKANTEIECRDLAEVGEEKEAMEMEEMEGEEGEYESERDIVENECVDEDEDKQVQESNDDEEELQELKQNGQCQLPELLRHQTREIEDENIYKFTDEVGTIAESQTQAEMLQVELKTHQDEEEVSSDEDETENSADEDNNDEDEVKIYHKDDHLTEVFGTLREFRDSPILTDLTLSTVDGRSCHVHSPVLAAVSSHIWESLRERTSSGINGWSMALGPEVDRLGLEAVVEFAYTGLIPSLNKDNVHQIKAAAEALGAPKVLDLCTDEEEKSKNAGGQKKEEGLSAAEQMMISFQAIKKLRNDRVGCDVILEAIGGSLHGE